MSGPVSQAPTLSADTVGRQNVGRQYSVKMTADTVSHHCLVVNDGPCVSGLTLLRKTT